MPSCVSPPTPSPNQTLMDHANMPMQQHRQINGGEGAAGNVGVGGRSGGGEGGASVSVCRPSGTRWTPTSEQIRILRELYYNCGIRSPNSEQIQRIAAMLRQYGRIEGKNVFYWFQNHKARERQKKRLTTLDVNTSSLAAADVNHLGVLSLSPSGETAPTSPGLYAGNGASAVQQLEASTKCWDSIAMATERSFLHDYMGVSSSGAAVAPTPWAGFSSDQMAMATREPETLPLFPTGGSSRQRYAGPGESGQESIVHGSYLSNFQCWGAATAAAAATTITIQQHQLLQMQEQHSFYSSNQLPSQDAVPAAAGGSSLELTLSSYGSPYPAGSM